MLEYMQIKHRWIERPAGRFPPSMVQLWDDLFALCEKRGLRLLHHPLRHLLDLAALAAPPLQRRERRAADEPVADPALPRDPRAHQGPAHLRGGALGRLGRAVRLGPVERDPSGAVGGWLLVLGRLHRRSVGACAAARSAAFTAAPTRRRCRCSAPNCGGGRTCRSPSRSSATRTSISRPSTSTANAPSTTRRTRWRRGSPWAPWCAWRWPRSGTTGPSSTRSTGRSTTTRTAARFCPSPSTTSIFGTCNGRTWPRARPGAACAGRTGGRIPSRPA